MRYHAITEMYSRELALAKLSCADTGEVCKALVEIAFCEQDWIWAQNKFLEFLDNSNPDIGGVSATCLGHIARIHGAIDKDKVVPALKKHRHNKFVRGQIMDALDDIEMFFCKAK